MQGTPSLDPEWLLPSLVHHIAEKTPAAIWAEYPLLKDSYDQGFGVIAYERLRNAMHMAAWHLRSKLGNSPGRRTLAYIGPGDARYQILFLAAARSGFKMFFPSPRNSISAQIQLLEQVGCTTILVPSPRPPPVTALLQHFSMNVVEVPLLEMLLSASYAPFPFKDNFQDGSKDEILVLHSSGTTGIPKPLTYSYDFITYSAMISRLQPPDGFTSFNAYLHGKRIILLLPSFHIAGIYFSIINAIYNRSPIIFPLPDVIPTSQSLVRILEHTTADVAFSAPVTLEELSKTKQDLTFVTSRLSLLMFSGAPLSATTSKQLSSCTRVLSCYGSSEYGAWPVLLSELSSNNTLGAQYIRLHPSLKARFRHRFDNLFELVLPFNPAERHLLTPFLHYPNLRAYHTRDLFSPHPEAKGLWRYQGRNDDIIVFSNGEKTNPVDFEGSISTHPTVKAALMVGAGRSEAALLIESAVNKSKECIVGDIWPAVQRANQKSPRHARVSRDRIMLADFDKPFARAGKGTVQRLLTLQMYAKEIDALYADAIKPTNMDETSNTPISNPTYETRKRHESQGDEARSGKRPRLNYNENIASIVREICALEQVDNEDNFLSLGMDSIQILKLSREMKRMFGHELSLKTIFQNPSVTALTEAIRRIEANT